MELIPVIYTVLKIVVVLTILSLTVSYISNRIRQRKGENVTNNNENAYLFEPIVKVVTPLKSDLKPIEARQEKSVREKKKDDSQRRHAHKDPSKHKVEPRTDKPRIKNERISVLKNLSSPSRKEELPKETKSRKGKDQSQSLGDDILDKYFEEDDNDMFTLKVKNEEKPEDNE